MPTEICFTPASQLARLIKARKLSATEVVKAFIAQIERVNPKVNAIVTFLPELALKAAKNADRKSRYAGLPIAYKDLMPTKGIRTTFGSLVFERQCATEDGALVERLTAAGAILLGKTNTPEFGAGSQTFNKVFGATNNPYDLTKTCGGSSGGAAAAVACGMLPFADGGDLAASLRNPGNYCNVVGFRPSPGRVSAYPEGNVWNTLSTLGPIARTVDDCAFLLSGMAGPDPRAPTSITRVRRRFPQAAQAHLQEDPHRVDEGSRRPACRARGDARSSKHSERSSKTSAASSRTPSPISPAPPSRSRPCARSASSTRSARC